MQEWVLIASMIWGMTGPAIQFGEGSSVQVSFATKELCETAATAMKAAIKVKDGNDGIEKIHLYGRIVCVRTK